MSDEPTYTSAPDAAKAWLDRKYADWHGPRTGWTAEQREQYYRDLGFLIDYVTDTE